MTAKRAAQDEADKQLQKDADKQDADLATDVVKEMAQEAYLFECAQTLTALLQSGFVTASFTSVMHLGALTNQGFFAITRPGKRGEKAQELRIDFCPITGVDLQEFEITENGKFPNVVSKLSLEIAAIKNSVAAEAEAEAKAKVKDA